MHRPAASPVVAGPIFVSANDDTHPDAAARKAARETAMIYYVVKLVVSAALIVAISEIAKRSSGFAALVASLPTTTLLAFVWLGLEGEPAEKIAALSGQIFWLVLPSLILFPLFAALLKNGVNLWASLGLSSGATALAYFLMLPFLRRFGVSL
jgi:hypothetical protein